MFLHNASENNTLAQSGTNAIEWDFPWTATDKQVFKMQCKLPDMGRVLGVTEKPKDSGISLAKMELMSSTP